MIDMISILAASMFNSLLPFVLFITFLEIVNPKKRNIIFEAFEMYMLFITLTFIIRAMVIFSNIQVSEPDRVYQYALDIDKYQEEASFAYHKWMMEYASRITDCQVQECSPSIPELPILSPQPVSTF